MGEVKERRAKVESYFDECLVTGEDKSCSQETISTVVQRHRLQCAKLCIRLLPPCIQRAATWYLRSIAGILN